MGISREPDKVQYFCGVICAPGVSLEHVRGMLENAFGTVDFESPVVPFDFTTFYEPEMGPDLQRVFFAFEQLLSPDRLAVFKCATNDLEMRNAITAGQGTPGRRINLDPGYVDLPKMVLATTKNAGHRVYLDKGIYAESTLNYTNKTFAPWPWTYPDYRTEPYIKFFLELRDRYVEKLKSGIA